MGLLRTLQNRRRQGMKKKYYTSYKPKQKSSTRNSGYVDIQASPHSKRKIRFYHADGKLRGRHDPYNNHYK